MTSPISQERVTKRPGPSVMRMLGRGATMACPACGNRRGLFRHWTKMADGCPHCGLTFGRFEGQWIGAIGINTIVSFFLLMITILVSIAVTYPDSDTAMLIAIAVGVAIVTPVVLFPFSRTFWMAMDISMTPLEPHEVDWTRVDPSLRIDSTPSTGEPGSDS